MDHEPRLTDEHFVVLAAIAERPGSTPENIARRLGRDVDEVLRLLGDLDASGMVKPGREQ